jgi:hypothetical protein
MLYIHTSKIASILGYNRYTTQEKYVELFLEYLYKNRDDLSKQDNIQILDSSEKYNQIVNKVIDDSTNNNKEKLKELLYENIISTSDLITKTKNINALIDELDYNKLEKGKIKKEIQHNINCNYGINTELTGISRFEELTFLKVYNNNAKLFVLDMDYYKICGKADGFCKKDDKEYIFEMKNRKFKLFDNIPIYETIQLVMYTKLCNINNIIFVQNMDDNMRIEYFEDYNKEELYNEIIKKLNKYIKLIIHFQNNHNQRKLFLQKSKRQKYKYILDNIN